MWYGYTPEQNAAVDAELEVMWKRLIELVQVAWEAWPAYLASLPRIAKAVREYAAAGTHWNHLPGVDSIQPPGREHPIKIAPIMLVEE